MQVTHTSLICNLSLFCCKLSALLPFLDLGLKKIENNLFFLTSSHSCSFTFIFHLSSCIPGCSVTCDKQNEGSLHMPCEVYIPSYYECFVLFFITNWHCWLIFSLLIFFFSELFLSLSAFKWCPSVEFYSCLSIIVSYFKTISIFFFLDNFIHHEASLEYSPICQWELWGLGEMLNVYILGNCRCPHVSLESKCLL